MDLSNFEVVGDFRFERKFSDYKSLVLTFELISLMVGHREYDSRTSALKVRCATNCANGPFSWQTTMPSARAGRKGGKRNSTVVTVDGPVDGERFRSLRFGRPPCQPITLLLDILSNLWYSQHTPANPTPTIDGMITTMSARRGNIFLFPHITTPNNRGIWTKSPIGVVI